MMLQRQRLDYETCKRLIMGAISAHNAKHTTPNGKNYAVMVRQTHTNTIMRIFDLIKDGGVVLQGKIGVKTSIDGLAAHLDCSPQTIEGSNKTDGHLSRLQSADLIGYMKTINAQYPTYQGGLFIWINPKLLHYCEQDNPQN